MTEEMSRQEEECFVCTGKIVEDVKDLIKIFISLSPNTFNK